MVLKLDVEWSKAVAWKVVMELYGMVGLGFMEWTSVLSGFYHDCDIFICRDGPK